MIALHTVCRHWRVPRGCGVINSSMMTARRHISLVYTHASRDILQFPRVRACSHMFHGRCLLLFAFVWFAFGAPSDHLLPDRQIGLGRSSARPTAGGDFPGGGPETTKAAAWRQQQQQLVSVSFRYCTYHQPKCSSSWWGTGCCCCLCAFVGEMHLRINCRW